MIGAGPTLAGVMLFGLALAVPIVALTVGDTRPTPAQIPYLLIAGLGNVLGLGAEYIALRTGKVVKWDAQGMRATNAPEAQPFIEGTYRKGWELPA